MSTNEGRASIAANRSMEPGKLSGLVRGELDWIVMKALEKDRNRRYETANGFAADVLRYLNDEAVQACPPSTGYRLRKLVRRNKGPVLAALLVLAVLVIGIVGTTWGMIRAMHAEAEAGREAREKTVALGEKVTALATAKANEIEAHKQEALAKENANTAREQELLARRRFYAAQINLAQQAWEAGEPARVLELLEGQRPKCDEQDLRGFEWYYLWRLCHQNLHRVLRGPTGPLVYTLAVTPDGKTLVSGSTDGVVRVWDVATGDERAALVGHTSQIWRVAISPDGKMVASGSTDATVKLWSLENGQLLDTLSDRTEMVRSVAFSPDGKTLAVGTEDCALELWDVATRSRRLTLPALSAPAIALAYSPDGKMLATGQGWNEGNVQGGVKVWDATSEPPRMIFQGDVTRSAAFSSNSELLATCPAGAKILRVPSGELQATLDLRNSSFVSAAFSADGNSVILGCDRTVKLWEFNTGATRTLGAHLGSIQALAVVPQSNLVASASSDGTVKIWRTGSSQDAASVAQKSAIRSLAFTPDSEFIVVGSDQSTAVLDAASGKEMSILPVNGVLAASADANLLVADALEDKRVIWDVAAARARAVLPVGPNLVGATFSRDGKTLATWSKDASETDHLLLLWDLAASRVRFTLKLDPFGTVPAAIRWAAFSPDDRTLAIASQFGSVTLWDATTGQQRATFRPFVDPTQDGGTVAFSNDGKSLAAGDSEGTLRLWNVETEQLRASFKGHAASITFVAFSPDDKRLLSGGADKTARLWDVVTGQEVYRLKGHDFPVHLVAFAPHGKRVATASHNVVKLWHADTEPEAAAFRVELDPDDPDSPRAANLSGDRLAASDQPEEAEASYRKAQARLEKLIAAVPNVPEYRQELAYSLLGAALLPSNIEQAQIAEQTHRQLRDIYQKLPPDQQHTLAQRFNLLAWHLATGPDVKLRDPSRSVELAKAAVELTPQEGRHWRTLGISHYRAGDWQAAGAALRFGTLIFANQHKWVHVLI